MSDSIQERHSNQRLEILSGDLRKTVFLLALPVLLEQFLSFCVGFYDTFLAGQISKEATNAIGLAAYVGWLASMLFGLVATGTTALVARHWGAGQIEDARRITNRSIALAVILGSAVFVLVFFAAPGFTRMLAMSKEQADIVIRYLRIDGVGHLFTSVTLVGAAALRGSGDMRRPLISLGTVSIANVIASTAFVYGVKLPSGIISGGQLIPPMGIDGIIAGTIVARLTGVILMVFFLVRDRTGLAINWKELKLRGGEVARILRIGGPAGIDGGITWLGHLFFLMIIARLDSDGKSGATFAAHMIGIRVEGITYLPAVAWGVAAATMVGQSLGAKNSERAMQCGHETARQCGLLALGITLLFFFGAPGIYHLMHTDPTVREIGIPAFRMIGLFQIPLALSITYVLALRGAGDTVVPLLINVGGVFGIRLTLAYLFGIVFDGGLIGAWLAMGIDVFVRAMLAWAWFRYGRWTRIEI